MSDRQLTTGEPVPEDGSHLELGPNGQQKAYVVLTPEERAKGFVKPVRHSYIHDTCGSLTSMGNALSETYARNPYFYSGTFCCWCGTHFPLSQFHWSDGEPMEPSLQEAWAAKERHKRELADATHAKRIEATERAELARLKAKYETDSADIKES